MSDRLTLTRAFEGAGIAGAAAERLATEIYDAIHANVATKTDVAATEASLKADIAAVRGEMQAMELRLKNQIDRMMIRLGGLVIVVAGLLFAALHYWAPAGPARAAPSSPAQHAAFVLAGDVSPPYSCRLLYDEQKKCAFGGCDNRVIARLTKECLRDGGRP